MKALREKRLEVRGFPGVTGKKAKGLQQDSADDEKERRIL